MQPQTPKISKKEKEVLELLTKEFLTIKAISQRRQTTVQNTYKILQKLKEKGLINYKLGKVEKIGGSSASVVESYTDNLNVKKCVRLHGEAWKVQLLSHSQKYDVEVLGKSFLLDGFNVQCHLRSLLIYSNKSFFGVSGLDAERLSSADFRLFLLHLESLWRISLLKDRVPNISRFRAHYAHVDDRTAVLADKNEEKIGLKGHDGKVWLLADRSFSQNELETVHPDSSDLDMDKVVLPFYQNLKDYYELYGDVPRFTHYWKVLEQNSESLRNMKEEALIPLTVQIKKHLKVMSNINLGLTKMNKVLEKMNSHFSDKPEKNEEHKAEYSTQSRVLSAPHYPDDKKARIKELLEAYGW